MKVYIWFNMQDKKKWLESDFGNYVREWYLYRERSHVDSLVI